MRMGVWAPWVRHGEVIKLGMYCMEYICGNWRRGCRVKGVVSGVCGVHWGSGGPTNLSTGVGDTQAEEGKINPAVAAVQPGLGEALW